MEINSQFLLSGDGITHLSCSKNDKKFEKKLPDTIVIHYTAGRNAKSSANYLGRDDIKASAHLVIGRDGEIFQLVPFNIIAWHAGKSSWGDRTWLNKYSIGIELDNAGVLNKVGDEYQAWFGAMYKADEVLFATHRNETLPRYWKTYTEKQIAVCRQVCQLLIAKFDIKTIVGHEEIAPGRKQDPGPAFPLDKFRERLLFQNRSDEPEILNMDGVISVNQLNIRAGAGVNFKKVALPLKKGTKVKIIEEENGWFKVETSIEGWVSKDMVNTK